MKLTVSRLAFLFPIVEKIDRFPSSIDSESFCGLFFNEDKSSDD